MTQVRRIGARQVWVTRLVRPFRFESPFDGEPFVLLLAVFDGSVTDDEQQALSDAFVEQGCRYAVCFGEDCSSWDDSIDWGFLATDPNLSPPDDRFVMTSWHEGQSFTDAAEFFVRNTGFDDFKPTRFVLVTLGGDEAEFDRARNVVEGLLEDA